MLPSERLFFNRDDVHEDRRALHRAMQLYEAVEKDADQASELGCHTDTPGPGPERFPSPHNVVDAIDECEKWNVIAEVGEGYPRLLTWLAEGRASAFWNVFGAWPAMALLIPGLRSALWRMVFKPVAHRAAWRPAVYEATLQAKRVAINARADRRATVMTVDGAGVPGLSAVTDEAVITPTLARTVIRQKIVNMTSGCIGISGLRGAGKTTLIRDLCSHRYGTPRYRSPRDVIKSSDLLPGLRIMVQAPLRFDSREFLIHQYTCLCRAVLADVRFNPTRLVDIALGSVLLPRWIRPTFLLGSLSGVILLALSALLAFMRVNHRWPDFSHQAGTWELIGAIVAFVAAMMAFGWRTRRSLIEIRQVNNLAVDADARLRRLQFQRTDTQSRGAAVGGPLGAGLNVGATKQFVEQAMTMPELIDDYRDFVERVVGALQEAWHREWNTKRWENERPEARPSGKRATKFDMPSADVRLIIGIDALDQIDDPGQACMFLQDLSAACGIPKCVHLISLSPSTMAAVDQRSVPLRTFSGGMFDEMVWLEPHTLNESCQFLDHRVTGLPASFIALVYVLSGGLPRELVRVARSIFTAPETRPDSGYPASVSLAVAANHVIEEEIRALKHRTLASAAALDEGAASALFRKLTDDTWPISQLDCPCDYCPDFLDVKKVLDEVSELWGGESRHAFANDEGRVTPFTAEVCNTLLSGLYFLLTARQLFTADPRKVTNLACRDPNVIPCKDGGDIPRKDDFSESDRGWLDDHAPMLRDLARARIALGVNPHLAECLIHDVRTVPHDSSKPNLGPEIKLLFLTPDPPVGQTTLDARATANGAGHRQDRTARSADFAD